MLLEVKKGNDIILIYVYMAFKIFYCVRNAAGCK